MLRLEVCSGQVVYRPIANIGTHAHETMRVQLESRHGYAVDAAVTPHVGHELRIAFEEGTVLVQPVALSILQSQMRRRLSGNDALHGYLRGIEVIHHRSHTRKAAADVQ